MNDNLEHGRVHVDVDYEIPNNPLWAKSMRGVTTHFGKRIIDSLLDHRGKKELRLS